MHVVLDTNAFFTDLRMNGAAFEQLFEARAGLTLCLPAVVVEEAVAHFARQVEKGASEIQKLDRLLGRTPAAGVDVPREEAAFRDHLVGRFGGDGRKILPMPGASHAELAHRATRRRRPFQDNGTGYRDALIWHSLVELAATVREPVLFVSNNHKDFGVGPDGGALHGDLIDDLKAHGIGPDGVRLCARVDDVLRDVVRPKLKSLEEVATGLAEETFPAFALRNWIEEELSGYVAGEDLDLRESRRRYDALSVSVVETGHVDEFEVEDVYELPSHAIGVEFNARVETYIREEFDDEDDDQNFSWERDIDGERRRVRTWSSSRRRRSESFHKFLGYRVRITLDPQTWTTVAADASVLASNR